MSEPLLEVRGVDAGYGRTVVIRDVDLTVPRGHVVSLLGPNGAGKTTLLRVVAGLLTPRKGTVVLGGVDVTRMRPYARSRRGLCLVPEGRGVYPALTVRENLALHVPRHEVATAVDRAVEIFPGLGDRLGLAAAQLSGGQQQMLAVVRSYLANPQLVLVDEVSMGLAPVIVDDIYEFLTRIVREGTSLVLVEQYVSRALAVADRACVMARGQVVFSGAPGELLDGDLLDHYLGGEVRSAAE